MFTTQTTILDLGASRAALGVFRLRKGRLCLAHYAVERFSVQPDDSGAWINQISLAVQELRLRRMVAAPVVLVLPAHLLLTKRIKTPRVEPAKRAKVIRFEAEQSIPYALEDVVWGSVVVAEQAMDLEVMLAAAKLEIVEPICGAVQAAGFEPRLVLPSPLATLAGYRLIQAAPLPSALVLNLGARSSTLLQVEGVRFATRSLAVGGQDITQQISANQDCDFAEAEAIKLAAGNVSQMSHAMENFATRLAQEITRSVMHFHRQSNMVNPAKIWLVGGSARLARLDETLALKLKVPVARLDVLRSIEIDRVVSGEDLTGHAMAMADLIGAAATQLLPGQPVLNLLPPGLCRHESQRRRQPWLIAAAVLVIAAVLPPILHFRAVTVAALAKSEAMERELVPLRARAVLNRGNLQRLEELRQQVAPLQAVHDRRTSWLNLMTDLQERLGRVEDVWLDRMSVTAAPGMPLKLSVSGRMLDKANPLSKVSPETFNRAKALIGSMVESPFVAAVEAERFDNGQPGILKFDFVLVADAARPL